MNYKNDLSTNCPDSDGEVITDDRRYYRATKNSPPIDHDFVPVWQLGQVKNPRQECKAKGVSLYEDIEGLVSAMKMFGNIGSYIYSGIIRYKIDGIVQITHGKFPSHRTWYPYVDIDEKIIFQVKEK